MKKIVYIQPIHPSGMEKLATRYTVVTPPDSNPETLKHFIADADVVVTRLTNVDKELMACAPQLKAVAKHGVGVDNIAMDYAAERGIAVLTTGNANSLSVAEHAFFAMGALYKRIPLLDRTMRQGDWAMRDKPGAFDVSGRTLGIIGLGKIGSHLARMAQRGFDMRVLVHDPYATAEAVTAAGCVWMEDLDELCRQADILSLHVPLTPETKNIIDARRLALLRPSACVLNFARGGVLDEEALYQALSSGRLAGAALDAFAVEPPLPSDPLFSLDNVILSPHCGTFTEDSRIRMSMQLAEGIEDYLEGRRPKFSAYLPEA